MPHRPIVKSLFVASALALVLGACGADGGDRASSLLDRPEQAARPVAAQGEQRQEPAGGRAVVYTAALRVSADDVASAGRQAEGVVERSGGFLFRQDSDLVGTEKATLVFKVPPERFQQVLGELGDLGRVLDRSVQANDVTDQVVDLEGRLGTARASVERLRGFLAQTRNVGEVAGIEAELARRESEAESLEGRLRVLRSTVGPGDGDAPAGGAVHGRAERRTPRLSPGSPWRVGRSGDGSACGARRRRVPHAFRPARSPALARSAPVPATPAGSAWARFERPVRGASMA